MLNLLNYLKKWGFGEIDFVDRLFSNEEKIGENKMENF